jgi:hypothetical protein
MHYYADPRAGAHTRASFTRSCWSLELAEKVSNYLNIKRIGKSSRPPEAADPICTSGEILHFPGIQFSDREEHTFARS